MPGTPRPTADEGYFPRGASTLRRVQGERSVGLTYGQRALLIGALDARNFVGTAEHSRYRAQPFRRLTATGKMFETVFFGTRAEADRVLATVERMHGPVAGELGEDSGGYRPGTRYSAFDPELMLWTIAVAAESAATLYGLFVRPLKPGELDSFWADWVRFGELFGMPRSVAPKRWSEFRAYYDERLASDRMGLTDEARRTGMGVAFSIPVPSVQAPIMELHNLLIVGSLPARARELYGIDWNPAQQAAFALAVRGIRVGRRLSLKPLVRGRNGGQFDNVARAEKRLIDRGRPPVRVAA